jgi:hypothetical protein
LLFVARVDNTIPVGFSAPVVRRAATAQLIVDGTITSLQIAANTITGSNIAAGTITAGNLAANTITSGQIAAGTIVASNIASGVITGSLIAANTITGANIVAGSISASQIAAATITGSLIAALTIEGNNIAAGTITASNIQAGAITSSQIAANTITGSNIAAGTITASNIQAGTITSSQIATGSIVASSLNVSTLSAITANLGSVTAGYLNNSANTTWLDLYNGRQQWQGTSSSYVLRAGAIGTGVAFWYGPASIGVGSETRTNGVWAFGTDGVVYYGTSALNAGVSAQQKQTSAASVNAAHNSWTDCLTLSFTIPAPGFWNQVMASIQGAAPSGDYITGTPVGTASGLMRVVERQSGEADVVLAVSGAVTATWSSADGGSIDGSATGTAIATTYTGAVSLVVQVECTSGSAQTFTGFPVALGAQYVIGGS